MDYTVFDIETQHTFDEVGGRRNTGALRLACAVSWSTRRGDFAVYWEKDVPALIAELKSAGRVVGFNVFHFDYEVLRPYAPDERLALLPTVDILVELERALGFGVSLEAVARATLGEGKTADGLQAVRWWREGRLDLLVAYCRADVDVTRRIYEFGCTHGYVEYFTRLGSRQKVKVNWRC
jgi:DEAD/DEAH box helicase domain-containing protein